jgi:hypothetical protein
MNLENLSINKHLEEKREELKKFEPITLDQVKEVLDLTIKKDDENKMVTFLAMLSAILIMLNSILALTPPHPLARALFRSRYPIYSLQRT